MEASRGPNTLNCCNNLCGSDYRPEAKFMCKYAKKCNSANYLFGIFMRPEWRLGRPIFKPEVYFGLLTRYALGFGSVNIIGTEEPPIFHKSIDLFPHGGYIQNKQACLCLNG